MAGKFSDQVVIVTGAASGIGCSQAIKFVEQGATVVAVDQDGPGLNLLDQAVPNQRLFPLVGDVRLPETAKRAVDTAIRAGSKIDVICNTAGVLDGYRNVEDTSLEQWQSIMDTDLTSQFVMIKRALPVMLEQGHGVFINMASIAGLVAGGGGVAYTAAKHAIIGLTKQLDADYAAQGIRANCIAPGAIQTPMNAADFAGDAKMANWVADQTPAKRWAHPDEVADLTLFLASGKSDYIHGSVVPIDGGWTEK